MIARSSLLILFFAAGAAGATFWPEFSHSLRNLIGASEPARARQGGPESAEAPKANAEQSDDKQRIKLSADQIAAQNIELATAQPGRIARRLTVPGTIVPDADRIARVAVKLSGTVAELRKKLGDSVAKDEVVAIIESREVADAK